ncbi:MAG: alpha/beta fold hydrolase [Planctomycetes bacterium]|nr:alpha/beta fold hydrolase [Planctomycetota bacterium]
MLRGSIAFTHDVGYALALPAATTDAPTPVLVVLHGFSEDGERMLARFSHLTASGLAVLAPDAPYPVEVRAQKPGESARIGHAWYQFTGDQPAFVASCRTASDHVSRVLDDAAARHGLDASRVVLLGYSQGGYLAGLWALTEPRRFAGLVAVSCRIKTEVLTPDALRAASGLRVLAIHGKSDSQVRLEPQQAAIDVLRGHGFDARLHVYEGGHGLRREVAAYVQEFAVDVLALP